MTVWEILSRYHPQLLSGLRVTLTICAFTYAIGLSVGVLLGIGRYSAGRWLDVPCRVVSVCLSALPLLVLLFWLHYPLQYMLGVVVRPIYTAIAALSIMMVFMVSDVVANALQSFPVELIDAARVAGLSCRMMIRRIQAPIVLREILPSLLFIMVTILQGTLFTSLISVEEIFRVAQQINSDIYQPVEIYTSLAFFFMVVCAALNVLGLFLRSRLGWRVAD